MLCRTTALVLLTALGCQSWPTQGRGAEPDFAQAWASAGRRSDAADFARAWASASDFHRAWAAAKACDCNGTGPDCPCADGATRYSRLYERAVRDGLTVALFVGCEAKAIPGGESVRWDGAADAWEAAKLGRLATPCVVLARGAGGRFVQVATLCGDLSAEQLAAELEPKARKPPAPAHVPPPIELNRLRLPGPGNCPNGQCGRQ